jgi:hypothetical protein
MEKSVREWHSGTPAEQPFEMTIDVRAIGAVHGVGPEASLERPQPADRVVAHGIRASYIH